MPQITGLSHVGIQVSDIARSLDFYTNTLGFELMARWETAEPYVQELVGYPGVTLQVGVLRVPGSTVVLEVLEYQGVERHSVDTRTANPGTAHFCVYVDDLEALHLCLEKKGVEFVSPVKTPTAGPNKGGRAVYVKDPDGIRIELLQSTRNLAGIPLATAGAMSAGLGDS